MFRQTALVGGLCTLILPLLLGISVSSALAQRDIGAKMRGEFGTGFWASRRTDRSLRHARDYSRDLYVYSRDAQQVEPQVARSEAAGLGKSIELARKDLETVRKSLAKDEALLASVAEVEKHLAAAVGVHKALQKECNQEQVSGSACMQHCSALTKELENALAEHSALLRQMEIKALNPQPARPGAGK